MHGMIEQGTEPVHDAVGVEEEGLAPLRATRLPNHLTGVVDAPGFAEGVAECHTEICCRAKLIGIGFRCRLIEKGVRLAVYGAGAHDVAGLIDRLGTEQIPSRAGGEQSVEVLHLAVLPEKGLEPLLPVDRDPPLPHHVSGAVDAAGTAKVSSGGDAEVLHLAALP